ncbi:MAG: hypothetical protein ACI4B3_07330 [Prevotella sp.]
MTLHIFNPEHDIALANGMRQVTPPHAARQLRFDLGFIPALWANEGDVVLVEDAEQANKAYRRISRLIAKHFGIMTNKVFFAEYGNLKDLTIDNIDPWGWDYSIFSKMKNSACHITEMPQLDDIERIMELSHRRTAAKLLPILRTLPGTIGEATECSNFAEVLEQIANYNYNVVIKAPWSCSGRGVRFVNGRIDTSTEKWVNNTLAKQKAVMVEPLYRRMADFGMEYNSLGNGTAEYLGLSLFSTVNGAYTGNVIATEEWKREIISRHIDILLIDKVNELVCSKEFASLTANYEGPFGIDMMVISREDSNGFLLHPCVEINLRRTMGHLALRFTPNDEDVQGLMQVVYEGKFKLRISKQ